MNRVLSERLKTLAESRGFIETSKLAELRKATAKETLIDKVIPMYEEYCRLAEELVEGIESIEDRGTARLGHTIALARVWYEQGDNDRFAEALNHSLDVATYEGPGNTAGALRDILLIATH